MESFMEAAKAQNWAVEPQEKNCGVKGYRLRKLLDGRAGHTQKLFLNKAI
jgi:hypothetical protein